MANEAADQGNQRATSIAPNIARLVMLVSWGSAIVLAWTSVISPDIRWRFGTMLISALVLAPTLAIALRHGARQLPNPTAGEQTPPQRSNQVLGGKADEEQSGIYIDAPTGLASRRYLNMFLHREINRSERARVSLSVAVFDVDEYHKLEEQAGTRATTTALADVGARLKSALREYDLVARYAAGRLVLVLPETNARAVAEVIERLHELATSVCVDGRQLCVTVGLAAFPDDGATAEELINSAHHALNRGKFAAANAVHTCDELREAS